MRLLEQSLCKSALLTYSSEIMMRHLAMGIALGITIGAGATAVAEVFVKVPTNGTLKGYIVQDSHGKTICKDPGVWNEFRGPESYIVCP